MKKGTKLHLKVVPNSSKNEICNLIDGNFGIKMLRIKIAAIADSGKANKELLKFLAKQWKIAPSDIEITAGENTRKKTILIKKNVDSYLKELLNN